MCNIITEVFDKFFHSNDFSAVAFFPLVLPCLSLSFTTNYLCAVRESIIFPFCAQLWVQFSKEMFCSEF